MEEKNKLSVQPPTDKRPVNPHFLLAVIAIIISCFSGFWTIAMALAALIFSLRASDFQHSGQTERAHQNARWAAVFGWLTVLVWLVPWLLIILFGGAVFAFVAALLAAL